MGVLQLKSPVRCAHSGLFPFCHFESKLSASKMKKAHQTSSAGFFFCSETLPGQIERQVCESYTFINPETGEKMKLNHTYVYNENPANIEEEVLG